MQRRRQRPGPLRAKVRGHSGDGYSSGGPGVVLVLQGARRIYHGDPLHRRVPQDCKTNDASHKTSMISYYDIAYVLYDIIL